MATEWCRKLQHFYNIWRSQPLATYVFTPADVASYLPPDEWQRFAAELPLQGPTRDRVAAIELMAPGAPVK